MRLLHRMYTKNTMYFWFCQDTRYTMYTEVIVLKKTESVTYRTDTATKEALLKIAAEKKWSISQLSEEIIKEWLQEKHPEFFTEA